MLPKGRLSKRVAISTFLLIPAALAGFWAVSANSSWAGEAVAYALSDPGGRAFLGVELEEETEHPEGGARIRRVVEDSAADEAGLEEGDIIVAIDGRPVRGPRAVTQKLREREPGDSVSITVVRNGRERSLDVELGQRSGFTTIDLGDHDFSVFAPDFRFLDCDEDDEDCSFSWSCSGDDCEGLSLDLRHFGRRPLLGVQLVGVTDELREHLGGEEGTGVLVSKVLAGTPAEDAGIEVGDLIVAVDGEPVEDPSDIIDALGDTEGRTIDVEVIRDGRPTTLDVTIPERGTEPASGPRAFRLVPGIELRGLHESIDRAMDQARDALHQSRSAYRRALRQAHAARSDAMTDARDAYRKALRQTRGTQRESVRDAREALRKSLDRRNTI
jgi:membrane-associated protease RseP (regulator of RpoE activity)